MTASIGIRGTTGSQVPVVSPERAAGGATAHDRGVTKGLNLPFFKREVKVMLTVEMGITAPAATTAVSPVDVKGAPSTVVLDAGLDRVADGAAALDGGIAVAAGGGVFLTGLAVAGDGRARWREGPGAGPVSGATSRA